MNLASFQPYLQTKWPQKKSQSGPQKPERISDAQHNGRILMRRVVIQISHSECVKDAVSDASQDDAQEDDHQAGPVDFTITCKKPLSYRVMYMQAVDGLD